LIVPTGVPLCNNITGPGSENKMSNFGNFESNQIDSQYNFSQPDYTNELG